MFRNVLLLHAHSGLVCIVSNVNWLIFVSRLGTGRRLHATVRVRLAREPAHEHHQQQTVRRDPAARP